MARATVRAVLAASVAVGIAGSGAVMASAASEDRLLVVYDSSGSMAEPVEEGRDRLRMGEQATSRVLEDLPRGSRAGLLVYGATVENRNQPGACTDAQMVYSPATATPAQVSARLGSYEPYGESPLSHALQEAGRQASATDTDRILLVSDGRDTCGQDPCSAAADLHADHPDLVVDVIGFRPPEEREALRCVATTTGGRYREASRVANTSTRRLPWERGAPDAAEPTRRPDGSTRVPDEADSTSAEGTSTTDTRNGLVLLGMLVLLGWLGNSIRRGGK